MNVSNSFTMKQPALRPITAQSPDSKTLERSESSTVTYFNELQNRWNIQTAVKNSVWNFTFICIKQAKWNRKTYQTVQLRKQDYLMDLNWKINRSSSASFPGPQYVDSTKGSLVQQQICFGFHIYDQAKVGLTAIKVDYTNLNIKQMPCRITLIDSARGTVKIHHHLCSRWKEGKKKWFLYFFCLQAVLIHFIFLDIV